MQSIHAQDVKQLLKLLKSDFPDWDGTSSALSAIFKEAKLDPKVRHKELYSEMIPDLAASYVWSETSLDQIAGECSRDIYSSKRIFIDVLLVPQYEATSDSTLRTTRRIFGSCELLLFLNGVTLKRAWCLFELAVNQCFFKGAMHVVGSIESYDGDFFERMEATIQEDREMLRQRIELLFVDASSFDAIVRQVVCKAKYHEALQLIGNDDTNARRLFQQAAEGGHGDAQNYLGNFYAQRRLRLDYVPDEGEVQSYEEALKLFRQAAEQKNPSGQYNLGMMHYNGCGVKQDNEEAARLFLLSAKQRHEDAQLILCSMYSSGRGVTQNYIEAVRWYELSAKQGNALGQLILGLMYYNGHGVQKDYVNAATWIRLSAEQGNATAQYNLGVMYNNGHGVNQSYVEAANLFQLSAEQGNASAQYNLGKMYKYGRGVAMDRSTAREWLDKAAAQGKLSTKQLVVSKLFSIWK